MFTDSTVMTPFPLKILMWETVLCWSPLFMWETEAGEGVALPGEEGNSRGVLGLFPSSATSRPYQPLTVGRWNSDTRDNGANYPPADLSSFTCWGGEGFFFGQQDVRVGFFLNFSEVVGSSCRMLSQRWNTAVSGAGWEALALSVCTSMQIQHVVPAVCVCNIILSFWKVFPWGHYPPHLPTQMFFNYLRVLFLHCWSKMNGGQKRSRTKYFHSALFLKHPSLRYLALTVVLKDYAIILWGKEQRTTHKFNWTPHIFQSVWCLWNLGSSFVSGTFMSSPMSFQQYVFQQQELHYILWFCLWQNKIKWVHKLLCS